MTTLRSWVPLSRGFREHLRNLSGNSVKIYIFLLTSAGFAGHNRGEVALSFADLAAELQMHRDTVHKAACELRPHYIAWRPAKNQHGVTVFTVQRFKSVEDLANGRGSASERTADEQQPNSTVRNPQNTKALAAPNKPYKPNKARQAWESLGISETLSLDFNEFWESSFANKNGYTLSKVMRDCANAWEASGGKVPGPFYAAKAEIIKHERIENQKAAETQAAKIPGPADCRPEH